MNLISHRTSVFQTLHRFLNPVYGLDLGTAQTTLLSLQDPQPVRLPTEAAYSLQTKKYYFGEEAQEMRGRVGEEIKFFSVFRRGWVEEPVVLKKLLKFCLAKHKQPSFMKSTWLVSYSQLGNVPDREFLEEMLLALGAKEVIFIPQLLLSALGAGVPITDTSGNLFVQIGAGVVEAAVISLGTLVRSVVLPYGSLELDGKIRSWCLQHKQLEIGESTARQVKEQLGAYFLHPATTSFVVKGRDTHQHLPKEVPVTATEIHQVIHQWLTEIIYQLQLLLRQVPSDLAPDVLEKGVIISGGGAQIVGIDEVISQAINLPVSIAEQSQLTVEKGLLQLMTHLPEYRQSFLFLAKEVA